MVGKLLGAVVGAMVGLLLGSIEACVGLCVVGAGLGHLLIDRDLDSTPKRLPGPKTEAELLERRPTVKRRATPEAPRSKLAETLAPIFVEVARADGEVNRDEIRVVREFFENDMGFAAEDLGVVSVALKEAIAAPPRDVDALVKKGRKQVKPSERVLVVNALYAMALIDGDLKKAEGDALKRVVAGFNLSEEQLVQITKKHLGTGAKHYQVLGLTEEATDDEIRAAFRRLAAENHPDKAAHLGAQEAAAAAERFREIKDAWEELKKRRGL